MKLRKFFAIPLAFALVLSLCVSTPLAAGAAGASSAVRNWALPTILSKKRTTPQHHSQIATDTASGSTSSGKSGSAAGLVSGATAASGSLGVVAMSGPPYCEINGTPYDTLDEALATILDNTQTTIKLLDNITYTDSLSLTDRNITFDLNGFDLVFNCPTKTALSLKDCNIDYEGEGSFKVISGVSFDENSHALSDGVVLFVDGGSCHVTSVESTGNSAVAIACTNGAKVSVGPDDGSMQSGVVCVKASGAEAVGIYADTGCTVTVNGDIVATSLGISADNSTVKMQGNITATSSDYSEGISASGSTLNITGNITLTGAGYGTGIDIEDFSDKGNAPKSVVTMTGDIVVECSAQDSYAQGISIGALADVTMKGDITVGCATKDNFAEGISTYAKANVTMKGDITVKGDYGTGIDIGDASTVVMVGNIMTSSISKDGAIDGVDAYGDSGSLTMQGDITATGAGLSTGMTTKITGNITATGGSAVDAEGGKVSVTGDVKSTGTYASAIYADASTLSVIGNVTAAGKGSYGVEAYDGAKVTVTGEVVAIDYGAYAEGRPTAVTIEGDITSQKGSGAFADGRATITIDGAIMAAKNYIEIGDVTKSIGDFTVPTTKAGYKTYTDNRSTVWVKGVSGPKKPETIKTPGGLPGTGDSLNLITSSVLLMTAAAAAIVLVGLKRRAVGR